MKPAINEDGPHSDGGHQSALDEIPARPGCKGDGCPSCLWTGLTEEDCDFAGLARSLASSLSLRERGTRREC